MATLESFYFFFSFHQDIHTHTHTTHTYIAKWLNNPLIHFIVSNYLWSSPQCTDAQITQTLKLRYKQSMGNQRKYTIWHVQFPTPSCIMCPLRESNTCLYLLSMCTNPIINNIQTTRHNKLLWPIHKLPFSHSKTHDTFLTYVGTYVGTPPNHTIHAWLYPCTCTIGPWKCLAVLKSNILIITINPTTFTPRNYSLHLIEFTFHQDRGTTTTTKCKTTRILNPNYYTRRCTLVCHLVCPHNQKLRTHPYIKYHQSTQIMLHPSHA